MKQPMEYWQSVHATMTIPEEELFQAMKAAKGHKNGKGADLVGINMEGPFINKEKKGAQKEETSSCRC